MTKTARYLPSIYPSIKLACIFKIHFDIGTLIHPQLSPLDSTVSHTFAIPPLDSLMGLLPIYLLRPPQNFSSMRLLLKRRSPTPFSTLQPQPDAVPQPLHCQQHRHCSGCEPSSQHHYESSWVAHGHRTTFLVSDTAWCYNIHYPWQPNLTSEVTIPRPVVTTIQTPPSF